MEGKLSKVKKYRCGFFYKNQQSCGFFGVRDLKYKENRVYIIQYLSLMRRVMILMKDWLIFFLFQR